MQGQLVLQFVTFKRGLQTRSSPRVRLHWGYIVACWRFTPRIRPTGRSKISDQRGTDPSIQPARIFQRLKVRLIYCNALDKEIAESTGFVNRYP